MAIIAKQRPGVYSDYQASGILYSKKTSKTIGIVAKSSILAANTMYTLGRLSDVEATFGTDSMMYTLCKVAFENGANSICAISAGDSDENYAAAFALLEGIDGISVVLCDSTEASVQQLLMQSVIAASQNKKERIGVIAAAQAQEELATWARTFNNERILLVAQNPVDSEGNILSGCALAAALAAVISQYADPSQSFNGVSLEGISKLNGALSEEEVDAYINSGIIPFEVLGGRVEIIRAVTSKTMSDGLADTTFKELNTVLVIDEVIKAIRETLSSNVSAAKNNVTTRSAISSQVTIKLQEFLDANIIDAYAPPSVYQASDDATICVVEVDFTVAQGINQIHITANINV